MAIIKCNNQIDAYRHRARSSDINELSGRTKRPELTRFVNQQIVSMINPQADDIVVDVGCGDGTFVKMVAPHVAGCIGILPTAEEVGRVRQHLGSTHPNVTIEKGVAHETGLKSASADKVVCNGVFLLLDEGQVDGALKEIRRIAKKNAMVFIGEIPQVDEFADRRYGDSVIRWLYWVWCAQGPRAFVERLAQVIRAVLGGESLIISPKAQFFESPQAFTERARAHGLRPVSHWQHLEIETQRAVVASSTRRDYLFVAC